MTVWGNGGWLFHDFMAYDWMTWDDLGAVFNNTPPLTPAGAGEQQGVHHGTVL